MITAIIGVIICQILLYVFTLILLKYSISKVKITLTEYFSPGPDQTPSPFALTVDNISLILAKHIVNSVKGYLLSLNSAEVRTAKAEARRELQESGPPLVSALLGAFPALGKKIIKNPEIAQLAMSAFQNLGKKEDQGDNHKPEVNPFKI